MIKTKLFFYFMVVLSIIAGILSLVATLSIPADTKNAFIFGFSTSRLAGLLFLFVCISSFITALFFEKSIHNFLANRFNSKKANKLITAVGMVAFFLLWVTLFTPTKNLFELEAVFIRSRPALIWLELILLQSVVLIKYANKSFSSSFEKPPFGYRTVAFIFLPILLVWVIISISKVGLVYDTAYWNVPGIPLSMLQFLGIILLLFLALIFSPDKGTFSRHSLLILKIMVPILIYSAAVLLWGTTPMLKHYFSLEPTLPNLQPYPYSDARVHDLGALSIVMGKGIYFNRFTDKPLYMLFLAILHVFTGSDYNLLQWALILVLALIPVMLYLFGKEFFGNLFGIVLAALLIFQQRNAIALSSDIASVDPKLLTTEELMLLGIVILTYLLFRWMRMPDLRTIFLLGGLTGAISLVRINPIFFVPVFVFVIILKLRHTPTLLLKQIILFLIGFMLVFSPWLFTGVDSEGRPWFFLKIQDVIQRRYPVQSEINNPDTSQATHIQTALQNKLVTQYLNAAGSIKTQAKILPPQLNNDQPDQLAWIMFNHFLHNCSTSLLALPDSITIDSLEDLSKREYWQDNNQWDGHFPAGQYFLIFINILIISIGIAISWEKYHWAGMAPLIVFFTYNLSLSAALNSGSRYIVPINWIVFFYFAFGLLFVCRTILGFLGIKIPLQAIDSTQPDQVKTKRAFKTWGASVLALVIAALLLPAANLVVPKFVDSEINTDQLLILASEKEPEDHRLISGLMLYPYYHPDNTISFVFIDDSKTASFKISTDFLVTTTAIIPESGMPAILSVKDIDGKEELKSIYVQYEAVPQLFWQKGGP